MYWSYGLTEEEQARTSQKGKVTDTNSLFNLCVGVVGSGNDGVYYDSSNEG